MTSPIETPAPESAESRTPTSLADAAILLVDVARVMGEPIDLHRPTDRRRRHFVRFFVGSFHLRGSGTMRCCSIRRTGEPQSRCHTTSRR